MANKANYIYQILHNELDLRQKTNEQVESLLTNNEYDKIDGNFNYLIKMPMDSVTEENVNIIMEERRNVEDELKYLSNMSVQRMWIVELEKLKQYSMRYKLFRKKQQLDNLNCDKNGKPKRLADIKDSDESDDSDDDNDDVEYDYGVIENTLEKPKPAEPVVEETKDDETKKPTKTVKKTTKATKTTKAPKKTAAKKSEK